MAQDRIPLTFGIAESDKSREIDYAKDDIKNSIRVSVPGIIVEFNAAEATATVQPAITEFVSGAGIREAVEKKLPVLLDVPVVYPHGGGCSITWPLAEGDECLLIFADMCINGWWSKGGIQPQEEARRHDLSDAFCIPGPFSQARKPAFIPNGLNIRSDSDITISTPGGTLKIAAGGAVTVGGVDIGHWKTEYDAFKAAYNSHTHGGVEPGLSSTNGPSAPIREA
jgi:hypothetical protein